MLTHAGYMDIWLPADVTAIQGAILKYQTSVPITRTCAFVGKGREEDHGW
jgi:hypothetical protein